MKKETDKSKNETNSTEEQETIALIKRLQQQLSFLEKKIDTLIARGAQKPFQENRFSKPFRGGGNSHRRFSSDGGKRSNGNRSGGFNSADRRPGAFSSFDQGNGGQGQGFKSRKKRPFRQKQQRY